MVWGLKCLGRADIGRKWFDVGAVKVPSRHTPPRCLLFSITSHPGVNTRLVIRDQITHPVWTGPLWRRSFFFFGLNLTFFSWTWQISRGIFHLGNKYPGTIWSRSCLKRRRESKVLFWNAERKEKLHYSPSYYSRTLNIYKRFYLLGFDGNKTGQIRSKNIPP